MHRQSFWSQTFQTYRSGEGEAVLLFVTAAGLTLALAAGDLVFETLFEFFLGTFFCLTDLI